MQNRRLFMNYSDKKKGRRLHDEDFAQMICDEGAGARYSLFSGKAKKKI